MTPDVVAKATKSRSGAAEEAKRKRPSDKQEEEDVAPKRQRDAGIEHSGPVHADPAPGGSTASGDMETLEGDVQVEEKEQTPAADGGGSPLEVGAPPAHDASAPADMGADVAPGGGSQPAPPPAAPDADADAVPPSTAVPIHAKKYADARADLTARVETPEPTAAGAAPWAHLTDHLGDGARARLQALATLHLTDYGAANCPDAVRQLPPNSARLLLGAPPNCELYQERVMRALARHVGARFLLADSAGMGLEDLPASSRSSAAPAGDNAAVGTDGDGLGGSGGPFSGSPWSSDDEDGMPSLTADRPFAPGNGNGSGAPTARRTGRPMARRTGGPPGGPTPSFGISGAHPGNGGERKRRLAVGAVQLNTGEERRPEDMSGAAKAREDKVEDTLKAIAQAEKDVSAAVLALTAAAGSPEEAAAAAPVEEPAEPAAEPQEGAAAAEAPENEAKDADREAPAKAPRGRIMEEPPAKVLATAADAEDLAKFTWAKIFVGKDALERASELTDSMYCSGYENRRWIEALDFAPAMAADCARLAEWAEERRVERAEECEDGSAATPAVLKAVLKINNALAEVRGVVEEGARRCAEASTAAVERAGGRAAEAGARPPSSADDGKAAPRGGSGADAAGRSSAADAAVVFKAGDRVMYAGAPGALAQAQAAAGVATVPLGPGSAEDRERERDRAASLSAFIAPGDARGGSSARSAALGAAFRTLMSRRDAALARGYGPVRGAGTAAAAGPAAGGALDDTPTPPLGALGRVVSASAARIEVEMDAAFPGGLSFPGGAAGAGFAASPGDLAPVDERDDAVAASFDALFDVVTETAAAGPLLVFLPAMDRMLRSNNPEQFRRVKERLSALPQRCLFVGGYCTRSLAREKPTSGASGLSMLFGGPRGGGDSMSLMDDFSTPWYERLGGGRSSSRGRVTGKGRAMVAMLPNTLELHPPHADSAAKGWKKMLEGDVAAMRERANRVALKKWLDRCGLECAQLEDVHITALALTKKEVEQVVGAAVAAALADAAAAADAGSAPAAPEEAQEGGDVAVEATAEPMSPGSDAAAADPAKEAAADATAAAAADAASAPATPRLAVTAAHLESAAAAIQASRAEAAPVAERSAIKDVSADQYERQLLSDVVPPEEIAVGFEDIGALDAVKDTLREVVILPLQRPELFTRGALTRPTKGLLLFGPPGTGKTMLAKAMAAESGAHFLNFSAASLTSRWLGDSEKLVRAAFSLAHKLAPTVIFIDEIDSLLSRRGMGSHEHEAVRKMKTEFLAAWDGLRTSASDRVLVLGATNRPMDLDDAAIRRMPRRIMVPLPDATNREKILRVILKEEELSPDVDLAELARESDGYSGSDLKNLCTAAAYCPLREFLEKEKAARAEGGSGEMPEVRPIIAGDFRAAMKQVTPSTHAESATMGELQRWNDQYGEGGSRRAEPLNYYT